MTSSSNWHILGAGAIGTLLAAALARQGGTPTLLLRDAPAGTQRHRQGLSLQTGQGLQALTPHYSFCADPAPISHLLITTKAYQSEAALASVAHRLTDDATLVVLHNGLGPQQQIASQHPQLQVYAGTTTEGAFRDGPERVVHAGRGETWLGPINQAARRAGESPLTALLAMDIGCRYDEEVLTRLWQKLAINAAINGLTVLHDCRNGYLASNPEARNAMAALCAETETLARKLGQPLFEQPLLQVALQVAEATADNYSSMRQDVRHGRPTELAAINGTLCQLAASLSLPLPAHLRLLEQVQQHADRPPLNLEN